MSFAAHAHLAGRGRGVGAGGRVKFQRRGAALLLLTQGFHGVILVFARSSLKFRFACSLCTDYLALVFVGSAIYENHLHVDVYFLQVQNMILTENCRSR